MKFDIWEISGYDRPAAVSLCRGGINPLVSVILASRGIKDPEQAIEFLKSDMSIVHDPFLLPDMDKAVERINAAIDTGEHIADNGDYDVDGMTSSCLMADYLRSRGRECEIYIPGRVEEGCGMHPGALDDLRDKGVRRS